MESSGIAPSLDTLTHPVQVPQNRVLEPKGQLHITNILYRKRKVRRDLFRNVARGTHTFWEVIPWRWWYVTGQPDLLKHCLAQSPDGIIVEGTCIPRCRSVLNWTSSQSSWRFPGSSGSRYSHPPTAIRSRLSR